MDPATDVLPAVRAPQCYDDVREHLFNQFQSVEYDSATGLSPDQLKITVDTFRATHPDMSRVLLKAHIYRIIVTQAQITLDPLDCFVDKLNHGAIVRALQHEWYQEAITGPVRCEAQWCDLAHATGTADAGIDLGHISPGWQNMFRAGLSGLRGTIIHYRQHYGSDASPEQLAFYEAVDIAYAATITLSERFAAFAETMADNTPCYADHLRAIAAVCRRVPAHAPRTFHEALQFAWLMHELIEMEGEYVRSMGHFDRVMFPYYQADIDAGRLSRNEAKELLKFFWIKWYARTRGKHNGKNFLFGGQHADGSDVTNELTWLALEAYEELNTPDPKLSVRFFPGSPERLYDRVADLIRKGHNSLVLMNDVPAIEGMIKRGKTREDARLFLPIGCYEPAVDGKEAGCTMNIKINIAKAVELAMHNGCDPLSGMQIGLHTGDPCAWACFEQAYDAFSVQLDASISSAAESTKAHEKQWPVINPSPLIAGTIDDCLVRGMDIGQGGAHYNSVGVVGVALANAADSLMALRQVVFEEKRFSMRELLDALAADFNDQEPMRQYLLNRVPKWGNASSDVDGLAVRIAQQYAANIHSRRNARGGPFQAALFTLTHRIDLGRHTGALPDGRKAHESLAPSINPMPGMDTHGVTGLIGSAAKLDFTETPNGSVLDITLHPSSLKGEEGHKAFVALIKTYFARGGYAIQSNVVDADTLRDAQKHPERYAGLQIRVTGWSVYFTTLSKQEQDHFIARTAHMAE